MRSGTPFFVDIYPRRWDDLGWLARNNPEWRGFALSWQYSFNFPKEVHSQLTTEWLKQTSSTKPQVLYNASVFFTPDDPELAFDLIKCAIQIEPNEIRHQIQLGRVFASALGVASTNDSPPSRIRFSSKAEGEMENLSNGVVIAAICQTSLRFCQPATGFPKLQELRLQYPYQLPQRDPSMYIRSSCDEESFGPVTPFKYHASKP